MFTFENYKVIIIILTRKKGITRNEQNCLFFRRTRMRWLSVQSTTYLTFLLCISPKNAHPKISAHSLQGVHCSLPWHMYHHPASIFLRWTKVSTLSPLNMSATWLVDSIACISILPIWTLDRSQWYFTAIFLLLGVILGSSIFASVMAAWLSSHTVDTVDYVSHVICLISANSLSRLCMGIKSHIAVLNAMYSASMVLSAISFCNLLNHTTGVPPKLMTKPVWLFTEEESGSSFKVGSGFIIMPTMAVPLRHLPIHLIACSCTRLGLCINHAHWFIAKVISGQELSDKYINIPINEA